MAITKAETNPRCPNVSRVPKGSRGSFVFGTSSSRTEGPRKAKARGSVQPFPGRLPPELGTERQKPEVSRWDVSLTSW